MPASTLYARIEETIATEIAQGEYHPRDQLPTEDELLHRFQVSRITVRLSCCAERGPNAGIAPDR
jgi:GntR family transcriptional regulator